MSKHRGVLRALGAGTATLSSLWLLGIGFYGPALADDQTAAIEKIEITGTAIRRTDVETPSPVQVITAEDLKKSGYTDVSDVLRNISANGAGTLSQSFNFAFAGGGSGIALRGLSVSATLVLINGHRMVPYPLSDDGQRSFVDVSSIPFDAVDSIEVLKDGASALYGSDAIAGVVNIKLKRTFVGAHISAEAGVSQYDDGQMSHVSGIFGLGDLSADGHNGFVSLEYRHQDPILVSNRTGLWNANNPAAWQQIGAINLTPGVPNPVNQGSPLSINSSTGVLVNPATGTDVTFLPGCTQAAQAAGKCAFPINGVQLQPGSENLNVLTRYTQKVWDNWEAATEASVFVSRSQQVQPYLGYAAAGGGTNFPTGLVGLAASPGGRFTIGAGSPWVWTVPANYPGNPYGAPAPLIYAFQDVGNPYTTFSTTTYRLVEELTGSSWGWDLNAAVGVSYAKTDELGYNFLNYSNVQTALNNGSYHVGEAASTNSAATYNFIAPLESWGASSLLNFIDLSGSRDLLQLSGGPLSIATGLEVTHRALNTLNAPSVMTGQQIGTLGFAVGHQNDTGAFVELSAQVLKQLELDASARADHFWTDYGSGGNALKPKAAFKFTPYEFIAFRGTWGQGFRIPTAAEAGVSASSFGAGSINDPSLCPFSNGAATNITGLSYYFPSQCSISPANFGVPNHTLSPERSTNWTLGLIFEPIKTVSLSADYYDIKVKNQIVSGFELGGLLALTGTPGSASQFVRGNQVILPTSTGGSATTPVGTILFNSYPYANATETDVNGIDLNVKSRFDLSEFGKLSAELTLTHQIHYNLSAFGTTWELGGTQGPSGVSGDTGNPRNRATLNLTWDKGPLEVSGTMNYIDPWSINDPSGGQALECDGQFAAFSLTFSPPGPFATGGAPSYLCHVASFTDIDMYTSYKLNKHLSVHGSVLNLFNRQPPLDISTYGGGGGGLYSSGMHQIGATGRFYTAGFAYDF